MDIEATKSSVRDKVEEILPQLIEISDWLADNPELGSEEYKSSKLLAEELEDNGFRVEMGVEGMETAFKAVYTSGVDGPKIAFLSEYDALPGVGHGCGHNIIGTASVGAGIALSKIIHEIGGEVWVVGTPAEEGHGSSAGAKRRMAEAGFFEPVDVALMIHPCSGSSNVAAEFLAVTGVFVEFTGRSAHAAADPHEGVNALNAAVLTYMAIQANRQQLRRDADPVIHGIITEGGLASNVIPDRATLRFGVRSSDDSYVPELVDVVVNSAKGAAIQTGCGVDTSVSTGLKSSITNKPLQDLFYDLFRELGVEVEEPEITAAKPPKGSSDFADVTHVVPGIHPMISIADASVPMHSGDFAEATLTDRGHRGLEIGAVIFAMAAVELIERSDLLEEVKTAFKKGVKGN
ncbi:MAG: M20 family metallopeptidase [Candidatus Bathyarchaeia archaeon]